MSYYSGQGRLYVAERNTDGTPKGFIPLGNVPALEVSIETTKFEHKESMSGTRAVDYSLVQEKKGTFTMTLEEMSLENLALAFWGTSSSLQAGTLSSVQLVASVHATEDRRVPIMKYSTGESYSNLSTVSVGDDAYATPTTTYEFGTSAGDVNSKNGWVDEKNGTLIIFGTSVQTSKGAAVMIADGDPLYMQDTTAYGGHDLLDALTESSMERWLRFEGLNTAITSGNNNVIIDIFKASIDPLQGYGLINEELASLEVSGSVLYDDLQAGTSKYFRQINVT